MILETTTAETPDVPTDAPDAVSPSIAAAGADLKAMGDTWEVPSGTEATPETPTEGEPAKPEGEATDALAGFQLDAEGRLHRADGTFADATEIAKWNEGAETATPTEEQKAEEPEPIVVKLRGRDGNEVEIEVTDEAAAEVLRTNHREGMRAAEFNKRMQAVQEKEAQFREFEALIETNPEAVILQHLPHEKQVSLAVALIAQHWDTLAPHLVKFDSEPGTRIAEAANARVRMTEQERTYEQRVNSARYSVQVESAVRALVPEGADEAKASAFMADAGIDLGNAIRARDGAPVPIEEVKQVLSQRLALYGFDKPTPAVSTEVTKPKRPLARPVAAPKEQNAPVKDVGAQVRRTVTAQRIAAATPPQGAGAATVRAPLQPSTATVSDVSKALQKAKSWADVR